MQAPFRGIRISNTPYKLSWHVPYPLYVSLLTRESHRYISRMPFILSRIVPFPVDFFLKYSITLHSNVASTWPAEHSFWYFLKCSDVDKIRTNSEEKFTCSILGPQELSWTSRPPHTVRICYESAKISNLTAEHHPNSRLCRYRHKWLSLLCRFLATND